MSRRLPDESSFTFSFSNTSLALALLLESQNLQQNELMQIYLLFIHYRIVNSHSGNPKIISTKMFNVFLTVISSPFPTKIVRGPNYLHASLRNDSKKIIFLLVSSKMSLLDYQAAVRKQSWPEWGGLCLHLPRRWNEFFSASLFTASYPQKSIYR